MNPNLSIVITCYNLGNYLQEAIDSCLNYHNQEEIEIVLVNDGSTDDETHAILEKIVNSNEKIIFINQPNIGLAKARNNGIKKAKGNYIIPLDADNKLRVEFIKQTIFILDNNKDIDVVHGDAQMFGNKNTIWEGKPFTISDMVLNNYIDACAGFRKAAWEKVGGYDENMPVMGFEDWDLWLRMSCSGSVFQYVNQVLFDYRVRDNSMLSNAWKKRETLLNYIFGKKELIHLGVLRKCLIENKKLQEESTFNFLINTLFKKIKRKFKI
jgi:glycosyltransferase involved in cell wall biosynthesis